jgi:hypothetical protein
MKGYKAFYNLVQDRAKWDFKHKIRAELGTEAFVLFHGLKRSEYRWYEFSVAGNISFGYVGRASGVPGDVLHYGAGWAEVKDPSHKDDTWCYLDCSSVLCGSYYVKQDWIKTLFDDPQDSAAVEVGIKMYDLYGGQFMTYANFQSALKTYGYLLAQSSEYHDWGWKNEKGNWPYEVGHFNGPYESKYEPIIQNLLFKR